MKEEERINIKDCIKDWLIGVEVTLFLMTVGLVIVVRCGLIDYLIDWVLGTG